MNQSTLSRFLSLFEESSGALSVRFLAQELDITPERVEGLLDFWIRKGRIRISSPVADCGSCGVKGDCPFIINLPRTFELVTGGEEPGLSELACKVT